MSYDIYLHNPITGDVAQLDSPHQFKGGTYVVGGTTDAHLNVTYNYSPHYYRVFKELGFDEGIRSIYGMTGKESVSILNKASKLLGSDLSENYWEATEGNAKKALLELAALAILCPDSVWQGD
jgi:hypothetical protein